MSKLTILRRFRNRLLTESDWTQLPDNQLNDAQKADWAQYRQSLRDITSTVSESEIEIDDCHDLVNFAWPVKPQ